MRDQFELPNRKRVVHSTKLRTKTVDRLFTKRGVCLVIHHT